LQAEKAPLYRAILNVLVAERARFVISLRPGEVRQALATGSPETTHANLGIGAKAAPGAQRRTIPSTPPPD
jgi:hypothetical protein